MVPFESLGAVSYSFSIVTMATSVAVCEIYLFSKSGVTLKTGLRFEMAPFDRSHTSSTKTKSEMTQCSTVYLHSCLDAFDTWALYARSQTNHWLFSAFSPSN